MNRNDPSIEFSCAVNGPTHSDGAMPSIESMTRIFESVARFCLDDPSGRRN